MFTPALKEDNFEYFLRLNQVLNARYIHLIWIQVKTRVLTCLFKEKKGKIIEAICSSFSAPPYPPHGVELTKAESAESHPHRSTRTRSLQHLFDASNFK